MLINNMATGGITSYNLQLMNLHISPKKLGPPRIFSVGMILQVLPSVCSKASKLGPMGPMGPMGPRISGQGAA